LRGQIPASFSAWVWKIARNRYSVWADAKRQKNELATGTDIGDCEIADDRESTLETMVREEQIALLRRELAFIGREYRTVIVAYYIENRSIREIAASLSLSESAVKQKLYRARIVLKEAVNVRYIYQYFKSFRIKHEIIEQMSVGAQPSLSMSKIRKFRILLPKDPIEQEKIAERLDGIEKVILQERETLKKLINLKKGLMRDLLTHKVSVDPLLERSVENERKR